MAVAALTVTSVAVLGGFGVLPAGPEGASATSGSISPAAEHPRDSAGDQISEEAGDQREPARQVVRSTTVRPEDAPAQSESGPPALPADSGAGRRIVFDESDQRVWLVDDADEIERTYPVSGSVYDNLEPGTYEVFSRSRHAVGIDDSGTMEYFVRFTHGDAGGAIGFHTIPVADGAPVQTESQLGTPLSHGCVRQRTSDAIALWRFAPIGTTVVVTA